MKFMVAPRKPAERNIAKGPTRIFVVLFLLLETFSIPNAEGRQGNDYRFYGFALPDCDDGGGGSGRCLTIIRIGSVTVGRQDWYIRWASKQTSPAAYRQVSANDPWLQTHVTCEVAEGGFLCSTLYPMNSGPAVTASNSIKRDFTVTPDSNVRLDFESRLRSHVRASGTIIDDIATVTKVSVPR